MRILTRVNFPRSLSVAPSRERKIKFHVVPSFPNPDPLVIDPFSPGDSYCLLAFLILCPKSLAWISAFLGHAGCGFFLLAIFEGDSGSWEANNFYTLFEDASLVHGLV